MDYIAVANMCEKALSSNSDLPDWFVEAYQRLVGKWAKQKVMSIILAQQLNNPEWFYNKKKGD